MSTSRTCAREGCGVYMGGRRARQKFCSLACRPKPVPPVPARIHPDEATCPSCGTSFRPHGPQKYCSRRCSPTPPSGNAKNKRPNKDCPTCGASFHPARADSKYCSRACVPAQTPEQRARAAATRKAERQAEKEAKLQAAWDALAAQFGLLPK